MAPGYVRIMVDYPWIIPFIAIPSFAIIKNIATFLYLELRSSSLPRYNHGPDPAWALVTGASDGIGFGFASELAAQGFNVILHGRNKSKVDGLIKDMRNKFPKQSFRAFIVDASDRTTWHNLNDLVHSLTEERINLTVLINNVGVGLVRNDLAFMPSEKLELQDLNNLIDVNATFPAQITRALLPTLEKNQPSLIVNMGSVTGILGMPYLNTYSGCKAFNFFWSRGLRFEMMMRKQDIEVFSVLCGKVQSAGTRMIPTSLFIPSSANFAQSTLQKVGCGYHMVAGYWGHAIQIGFLNLLPSFLFDSAIMSASKNEMAMESKAI